jgi:UDP-glucose 4-epimerase
MLVAVTGVGGLIGGAIAKTITSQGHKVLRVGRRADSDVSFDLTEPSTLARGSLRGADALIHAAGVTDEDFADRKRATYKANDGALALLEVAESAGIRKLVYVSSAHVYGSLKGRIDEAQPPHPVSDYGIAHLATEQLFGRAGSQPSSAVLILRPCAVYGIPPDLRRFARWSLVPFDFPRQALTGRIVLKTDGHQRRNFVSADRLGGLVAHWLIEPDRGLSIFNSPGPDEMSIYDLALLCAKIYREEFGSDCEIDRPSSSPSSQEEPFQYRSLFLNDCASASLEDHVRVLMKLLSNGLQQ